MTWTDTRGTTRPTESAPVLDMTPDGQFVDAGSGPANPMAARAMGVALLVAVLAGAIGVALLAFWIASLLIPVALIVGLIAYGVMRVQAWRAGLSVGGERHVMWR